MDTANDILLRPEGEDTASLILPRNSPGRGKTQDGSSGTLTTTHLYPRYSTQLLRLNNKAGPPDLQSVSCLVPKCLSAPSACSPAPGQ